MVLLEIEEILAKFRKEEEKIDNLLTKTAKEEMTRDDQNEGRRSKFLSYEDAKERNRDLLRGLETVKGNLRSKAIFSPTEMQWETICQRYRDEPALPVTTWRCNIPIFV